MTSFASILAATDFSTDGDSAVRRAALLAHAHRARLHIVHVLNPSGCKPLRDWFSPTLDIDLKAAQARDALRRVAVEILGAYDVSPTVEVVVGDRFEVLMQAAEHADLVVLGRRGRRRLEGLLVGQTVDRMLRLCRRPVLVVRTPVARPYRQVLVPIDFTSASDAVIRLAARMQSEPGMHVFHAIGSQREAVLRDADVPEHIIRETRQMEEAATTARMRRKVDRLGLDSTRMRFALGFGPAVRSTLRQAQALGVDLIVAGKQGQSTVGGFLLGNVSSRVLRGSACDMLIVPKPLDAAVPRAASVALPRREAQPAGASAALPRSGAARTGALSPKHWIHNTARFMPQRSSAEPAERPPRGQAAGG